MYCSLLGSPLSPSQFAEVFQFGPGYTEPPQEDVSDVTNLNCMILMLDLIIMQVIILSTILKFWLFGVQKC